MKERQHITIKIAGHAFRLGDTSEPEETLREVERNFNKLWAEWCDDFNNQNPQEVLAMVAFQYARFYYKLRDTVNSKEEALRDFERKLDAILLNVK